ncbi:MAG TPA: PEP-CTERM sorting domain-containing protein [Tepidisphaeraceae bacterium]|nr:PEP-CTERM sorting domain-containing protein [Tepidisphaeraceae bacterium]
MIQGEKRQSSVWRRARRAIGVAACAAAMAFGVAEPASADNLFSWETDPLTGPPPSIPQFTPAPFLNNDNAPAVGAYLAGQPVKAVKIRHGVVLTPSSIASVYGTNNVRYTFADHEGPGAAAQVLALRNQIAGSAGTGPSFLANQSFVGNYNFYPIQNDPTRPGFIPNPNQNNEYAASGLNMANESLYPGSIDFRSVTQGNSTSPNLRSELFTLPIVRASLVTSALPSGHKHIPYVSRFNNYDNAFMRNGVVANGETASSMYFDAAHGTAGQLLSRGDFKALIAHYRLRGAHGVHALDPGVVGYNTAQMESDVEAGWNGISQVNNIFAAPDRAIATLDTVVTVVGEGRKTLESAGIAWSGVYSLSQGKLAILLSNMSEDPKSISIPFRVGGKSFADFFTVSAGEHRLLDFTAVGTQWVLQNPGGTVIFADANRDGVGVPEPTSILGGVFVLGMAAFARRRRA